MDDIIKTYKERLNLQDACFSHIDHEDALVAMVFKVTLKNGKHQILKICSYADHSDTTTEIKL